MSYSSLLGMEYHKAGFCNVQTKSMTPPPLPPPPHAHTIFFVSVMTQVTHALSDCIKNFKKIYRLESFRANVIN